VSHEIVRLKKDVASIKLEMSEQSQITRSAVYADGRATRQVVREEHKVTRRAVRDRTDSVRVAITASMAILGHAVVSAESHWQQWESK